MDSKGTYQHGTHSAGPLLCGPGYQHLKYVFHAELMETKVTIYDMP